METVVINVRLDREMLDAIDNRAIPAEKQRTGFSKISRNEIIVKAIREYLKGIK